MSDSNLKAPSPSEIREMVIEELAKAQAATPDDVKKEIKRCGGDVTIKSLTATSVIGAIQGRLGVELTDQDDLSSFKKASVETLTWHISQQLSQVSDASMPTTKGGR